MPWNWMREVRVYGLLSLLCNFHRVAGKWVVGILRNKGSKLRGRRPRLNSRRDGVKVWNIVVRDVKGMYSYAVFDEFREERAMNLSLYSGWFIIIYCSILKAIRQYDSIILEKYFTNRSDDAIS